MQEKMRAAGQPRRLEIRLDRIVEDAVTCENGLSPRCPSCLRLHHPTLGDLVPPRPTGRAAS
eukprot:74154-Prymnesium_polylepis.1